MGIGLDLVAMLASIVRKVLRFWWSDQPAGLVLDAIPNPKRYLNV